MDKPKSEKGATIMRYSKRGAFTQIPNELIHHPELTGPAKLIWCYVWSRQGLEWVVRRSDVIKMVGKDISKLAITRGFESLVKHGWALYKHVFQDNGKAGGCTYIFTDEPGCFGEPVPSLLTYNKAKTKLAGKQQREQILLHPEAEYEHTLLTYKQMLENLGNGIIPIVGQGNAQERWICFVATTMNNLYKNWRPEKHFKGGKGTLEKILAYYEPATILRACVYLHKFGQPNPDKTGRKVKINNWTEFETRFSELLDEIKNNPRVYRKPNA